MEKVLSFRFQQRFSPIIMLLVKGSSETGLFILLSNHVFRSPQVQKYISYEGHFFCVEMFKMKFKFQKCKKNKKKRKCQKVFFSRIIVSEFVAINCVC